MPEPETLPPIEVFFQKSDLVVTFLLILIGIAFGNVTIKGIGFGSSGVLIAAMVAGYEMDQIGRSWVIGKGVAHACGATPFDNGANSVGRRRTDSAWSAQVACCCSRPARLVRAATRHLQVV